MATLVITKVLMLHILLIHFQRVEPLGINYGQVANNLPPPERVLDLLRALKVTKTRIYDTNPLVLSAFANSGIEIIVTVENNMLSTLTDPTQSLQWVSTRIKPYFPSTRITGIAVGNEVFNDEDPSLVTHLVPAMLSIHSALVKLGLSNYVQVSTPSSLAVLGQSFPPSAGCFRPELGPIMRDYLRFLAATGAPFWINAYPYFAYKDGPNKIPLDYVLFGPGAASMVDPGTGLRYDNMLYAQADAVVFAMAKVGFGGIEVRVSETGWPSSGDVDEVGATLQNAAAYNRNLMARQMRNEGTPARPGARLEVYVFALFNEDMKPGPSSERNYGLFRPDGTMAYNVGLSALSTTTPTSMPSPPTTPTGVGSISLTSDANKVIKESGYSSLVYATIFLLSMTWH